MAQSPFLSLVFLLSLISCASSAEDATRAGAPPPLGPPPRGCGSGVGAPYRVLCDLESVWGVVLEAASCGGAATATALAVVLLARLKTVTEQERRCGVGPLLLLLLGTVGLFGLSLAFLVGQGEVTCVVRRGLWGALFALCFSCLLAQALRLRRLAAGKRSPAGSHLSGLALGLTVVQGIIGAEWLLLTVAREGHGACDYVPLDFALACSYALGLLLLTTALALSVALCSGGAATEESGRKRRSWRCNGVWLFLACLSSLLLWAGWLGFYLYGDRASGAGGAVATDWDEPALAVALVTEGWVLLLFHGIPEAHMCLRAAGQRGEEASGSAASQDYFDARQPPMTTTQGYRDDEMPANHRAGYGERQAFSIEEHSAAVQAGAFHAGVIRPQVPFRSHVYQPTEMALLMNGGTIPTAPPNYTGRHLW